MTQTAVEKYQNELLKHKQNNSFGSSAVATQLIQRVLVDFTEAIKNYLNEYGKGKAVRSTIAARVIERLEPESVAFITSKIILNHTYTQPTIQAICKAIGQGLEDEYKMRACKEENKHYYQQIQKDLNSRGAKANRKKYITTGVFNKRLDFHLDQWTITEKFQAGQLLIQLFRDTTGLIQFTKYFDKKGRQIKTIVPTKSLVDWFDKMNEKLEVMQPFFVPMVCKPKEWTGIFEGGYISPYLKKNKLIKNNSKDYLKELETIDMPMVYEALNHLQNTEWQINKRVLEVVEQLWEEGKAVAELPDRDDEPLQPYPYPELTKDDAKTDEQLEEIKKWKRETYETYKRNVAKRSNRILVSQILRIANQFKDYEKIWFPYQMDFRGRMYPIPVLLQPQGTDLSKSLLHFAEGKDIKDEQSKRWFYIHGANVFGYDKANYEDRVGWVIQHMAEIKSYAEKPMENRGWTEADKPFQFLAWCFEFSDYINNPDVFTSHIPIQLDGTCNGLQHYSALLRDSVGGLAVNLKDTEKPSDIYATVGNKLIEKLEEIKNYVVEYRKKCGTNEDNSTTIIYTDFDFNNANRWLTLGINRKLTKRPVMVLPYGGTRLSCREYITAYLEENYSKNYLWEWFKVGQNPNDCIFKVSTWLSKYLWEAIQETLKAATLGMDYLRKIARIITKAKKYIEWSTPAGLLVRQEYKSRKRKQIDTQLFGSILQTVINVDLDTLDAQRQANGICPNFIHSLDAACLMLYLHKCKQANINGFMTVHDCYGTWAKDTEKSARFLREAFVEIYRLPIIEYFTSDVLGILDSEPDELPEIPEKGDLDIEEVLHSSYFFN